MTIPKKPASIQIQAHGEFVPWLEATGGSLLVTTYNSGKLAAFSVDKQGLRTRVWKFPRPMGLAIRGDRIALAARHHFRIFQRTGQNSFEVEKKYSTGKLDMHDVAFGRRGAYFINTKFNCLSRPSKKVNFLRCWQPDFISEIKPKDRCHLNGLGMKAGLPAVVTAFGETDEPKGWRILDRFTSGVLIDVPTSKTIGRGLCMPHSPRWNAGWWLCNSGVGTLEKFDVASNSFNTVCELPGFTRGLCFVNEASVVGLSKIREKHILDSPLLRKVESTVHAGIAVVGTHSGEILGRLEFTRGGSEVYEVAFLPGIRQVRFEDEPA
ncbi:TIGR03032 family protein [Adhaeretor mobilis]|uniref:Conserved hypothetical protein CHP03032 domain-containing protein n=1 Tax=Adhaeretor mobilis TaxID=1930276 RepID=A0A517MZN6_9BACT|nr:TIGR03032 family protein [Adhaeretor mobilis]QDT00343.1 hypothetical protein HG15A2_36790 [Adhaeretor mobilis]